MYLQIDLPHAFVHGDGLGVRYVSRPSTDQKWLQEQSCLELLCYLVVSAPARVRLHPSCFIGGEQIVQEFRRKAVEFGNLIGFVEQSLAWQIPEVHGGQPLVANLKLGDAESPVPLPRCEPPQPPPPGVGDHVAVLDTLRDLEKNKEYVTHSKMSSDSCSVIPPLVTSSSSSVPPSETLWPSPGPWTPPFNYTWVPLFHPNQTSWIRNDQIILVGVLQYKDKYACNIALAQKDKFPQSVIANIAEFLW